MDTVVLVSSTYAELLLPFAVFQACGLVLIFKSLETQWCHSYHMSLLCTAEEDCPKKDIPFSGSNGQEPIFYNVVGSLGLLMFSTALLQVFQ